MTDVLNLAIIGGGRIGRLHLRNLATRVRGVRVSMVADVRPSLELEQLLREVDPRGDIRVVTGDHSAAVADAAVDALVVCTPTAVHARICSDAVRAGKHVFCEKPVSADLSTLHDLKEQVDAAGVVVQVGFNRRFDSNFRRAREMIAQGRVGALHMIRIVSRDPNYDLAYLRESAMSGGIYFDFVIHDFDMLRYLVGEGVRVRELVSAGSTLLAPEIAQFGDIDTSVVTLRLDNGCLVIIDNSRKAVYGYDQRIEIFGSGGCIMVDNVSCSSTTLLTQDPPSADKLKYFFADRYADAFVHEMEQFVECVNHAGPKRPPVSLDDAYHAALLATAATQSLRSHQWVAVDYRQMLSQRVGN
eukprot:TRINITY_DN1299_c0_g1_i1.p1 TRINITY_DN1299_c0_g1~~TRINITY_DN1299_c0_g1_i1.p1  ORF type:complete len:358 (-),score=68.71 TRINITY_DN1299_c0_g1_i1:122-1195(-)